MRMSQDEIGTGDALALDQISLNIGEYPLHYFKQDTPVDVRLETGLKVTEQLLTLTDVVVRD